MIPSQLQFINYLVNTKDSSVIQKYNVIDDFFQGEYLDAFRFIKSHIEQYKDVPEKSTFFGKFSSIDYLGENNEKVDFIVNELVKDAKARLIIESFKTIQNQSKSDNIEAMEQTFIKASEKLSTLGKRADVKDILRDTTDSRYEEYLSRRDDFKSYFIPTGLPELDEMINGGWDRKEEFGLIVARTNVGKSWMLLNCAKAAVKAGLKVGLYSGEMSINKVGYRFDTLLGHISNSKLLQGNSEVANEYKAYLDDLPNQYPGFIKVLTPQDIGDLAKVSDFANFIENEKLDILFIDQISLIEDQRYGKTSSEKASNISKDLKRLQVMYKIPIVAVSQQNRGKKEDEAVSTEHVALSDRLSQDSTTIIFLEKKKDENFMHVNLVKSRDAANSRELSYAFNPDKGQYELIMGGSSDDTKNLGDAFHEDSSDLGDEIF